MFIIVDGGRTVKFEKKNIVEIFIAIIAVFGIIYSFYNVLSDKVLKSENRQEITELSDLILTYQKDADRLECVSDIYVKNEDQLILDHTENVKFVYDYKHERIQTIQKSSNEIIEYKNEDIQIYSKGITPVYIKEKKAFEKVSEKKWFHYNSEAIYGSEKKKALLDKISYGYLQDIDNIIRIEKAESEEINGINTTKYIVTIKNSLREDLTQDMGDTGLRKLLSKKGLNPTLLKNGYPTVYKLLKEVYNSETEELVVWLAENNQMIQLEKDCTFSYYVKVMKENSDLIESKVGNYDYPRAACIQRYEYNHEADMINLPQKFTEL